MKSIIEWFADNGVAANLLMALVVVGGLLTAPRILQEVFPEIATDMVTVSVVYPGATPEEVEESINRRIEDRIASIDGVKKISSTATEGVGAVTIEALRGTDVRALLDDVKSEVDAIDTFPEEAEQPLVREVTLRDFVIGVTISGDVGEAVLKRLGELTRDELTALPGLTQAELVGVRPYEIAVEVSEETLQRYGLTFTEVADSIRRSSLDLPAGSLETSSGEVLLRSKGQAYRAPDFGRIVLRSPSDGSRVLLGDVARVIDGFADTDQRSFFNGKPSATIKIFRVGEQSSLVLAQTVKDYVAKTASRMPPGVSITTTRDVTQVLRDRLDTLTRNGLQGLVLVFIVLALFLQFRLALWVTVGIPVSFLGTLFLMPSLGVSINVLSLFSFILVLGIVVDDAIVIGENVYKKSESGLSGREAAVRGTQQVSVPVVFGVLTTIAVFIPMLVIPGTIGRIMRVFPLVVIPTLLFSLVESQLILPSHLRHALADDDRVPGAVASLWMRVQKRVSAGLQAFSDRAYAPVLRIAAANRYVTAASAIAVVMFTFALVGSGWVGVRFFPDAEADNVAATLTMPQGTPVARTTDAVAGIEAAARSLQAELEREKRPGRPNPILQISTSIGDQPYKSDQSHNGGRVGSAFSGAHLGEVSLQLASAADRAQTSAEIGKRWREKVAPIPDVVELDFTSSLFSAGPAIQVELSSADVEQLREAADRLKRVVATYPGVYDVADSFRAGKQELTMRIKPEGEALGLTLSDLGRQVRQAFYGEEVQRVQRGREDVKVMVRYTEAERKSLATIENMRIRTADGGEVPLETVAAVESGRGYSTITRSDRRRIIDVTGEVDASSGNANQMLADIRQNVLPRLLIEYPGLSYSFEGEQREQADTYGALGRGFLVALVAIYALLAIPLGSYVHPLVVMSAIPPGIAGAVWAHIMFGMDLSFLSMFGIIALTGVVVNDSLVLVEYINRRRARGEDILEAVLGAGTARLRPILLTSLTTFAGLTPLLLERSFQAQFLIPMAVSLGFGVMFATLVSLVLVPTGYLILEDLRLLGRRDARLGEFAGMQAEPSANREEVGTARSRPSV